MNPNRRTRRRRNRALLRHLDPRGVLVVKDGTCILSMSPNLRAESSPHSASSTTASGRTVGTVGGRALACFSRVAVIGAGTIAQDRARDVIASWATGLS